MERKSKLHHYNSVDAPGELTLRYNCQKYHHTSPDYNNHEQHIVREEVWSRIKSYVHTTAPIDECYTKLYDLKTKTYCDLSIELAIAFTKEISNHSQFLIQFINSNLQFFSNMCYYF